MTRGGTDMATYTPPRTPGTPRQAPGQGRDIPPGRGTRQGRGTPPGRVMPPPAREKPLRRPVRPSPKEAGTRPVSAPRHTRPLTGPGTKPASRPAVRPAAARPRPRHPRAPVLLLLLGLPRGAPGLAGRGAGPPGTPRAGRVSPPPRVTRARGSERPRDPRRRAGPPPGGPGARGPVRSAEKIPPRPPPRPVYVKPPRPRRLFPRGNPARRLGVTLLAIVFVLTLFAARLVQLQGLEAGRYRVLALKQRGLTIALPPLRGTITGANAEVLAMTVATDLVYADPPQMPAADQAQVATKLAANLNMPAGEILSLIKPPHSPHAVVLSQ